MLFPPDDSSSQQKLSCLRIRKIQSTNRSLHRITIEAKKQIVEMSYDKEGYDLMKQAFEKDKAIERKRIRAELKEEFDKKEYVGDPNMQEEAMKTDRIKMSQMFKERYEQSEKMLEEKHFLGLGESHFVEGYKREEKIQSVQQKWRNQEINGKGKGHSVPGGLSSDFNAKGESKGRSV